MMMQEQLGEPSAVSQRVDSGTTCWLIDTGSRLVELGAHSRVDLHVL